MSEHEVQTSESDKDYEAQDAENLDEPIINLVEEGGSERVPHVGYESDYLRSDE